MDEESATTRPTHKGVTLSEMPTHAAEVKGLLEEHEKKA